MNLFRFLPRAATRLKLGVSLCSVLMAFSMCGLAQSQSQPQSQPQTSSDNGSSSSAPASQINNPRSHNVSTGNYIPPPPPSGPNVYYNHRWDIYGGVAYTNFLAGPQLLQRSNLGGWEAGATYWLGWHWGLAALLAALLHLPRASRIKAPVTTTPPSPDPASCSITSWLARNIGCFATRGLPEPFMPCSATHGVFSTLPTCMVWMFGPSDCFRRNGHSPAPSAAHLITTTAHESRFASSRICSLRGIAARHSRILDFPWDRSSDWGS